MKTGYILIVEDEINLAESIAEFLKLENYAVKIAKDGEEALELIKNNLPTLIVCDISMPKMDGIELLKKLRSEFKWSHIPFLFLTALSEKKDQRLAMELGADDFISKPFRFEELTAAIEARIQRHIEIRKFEIEDLNLDDDQKIALKNLNTLSTKELQILKMIANGHKSSDIAEKIFISPKTVENHRYAITKKLGLKGQGVLLKFVLKVKNQL